MSAKIWRKKGGAVTHIVTLGDFSGAADDVLPGHFAGKKQLLDIIRCFEHIENNYLTGLNLAASFDANLRYKAYSLDAAEKWLDQVFSKSFAAVRSARGSAHLSEVPPVYIRDAKRRIEACLPDASGKTKGEALAYLTLIGWIFAQKLSTMGEQTQRLLLSIWQPSLFEELYISADDRFSVGWDVAPGQPLERKLLVNDWDFPVTIILTDPEGCEHRVCFPPHTKRLSLFAGSTMTCIKSCIAAGEPFALMRAGDALLRLNAFSGARPFPYKPDEAHQSLTDYAPGFTLHSRHLSDGTDGVLAVFQGDFVIKVLEDGTIRSDHHVLFSCRDSILSVVQDQGALHAVMRDGRILSTRETPPERDEAMRLMLAPYGGEDCAERIPMQGGAYLLSSDGKFEYQTNQKRGDGA